MAFTTDNVRVEVAWTTTSALDPAPAWEDMTPVVALERGIAWNRGRPDSQSQVSAGQLTFTLRNDNGDFTPGKVSSPRSPNIVLGRRARVTCRTPAQSGNLLAAEDASFEGGTTGSWNAAPLSYTAVSLANVTTAAQVGTHSLQVTWATTAAGTSAVALNVSGMVIGRTYTLSAYVNVAVGSPAVRLLQGYGAFTTSPAAGFSDTSSTNGVFQRIAITFTPNASSAPFIVQNVSATTSGQLFLIDAVQLDEGSTVGTFTTAAPPITVRFDGTINNIVVTVDPSANSQTAITATDLLKQIGEKGALRSIVSEEILYDTPTAYWPLGEQAGVSAAGDISGSSGTASLAPVQVGSGGTVAFAGGTGPAYDSQAAVLFSPTNPTNGLYLAGTGSPNLTSNAQGVYAATLEAFVNATVNASQVICRALQTGSGYLSLEVTSTGKLLAVASDGTNVLGSVTSATNVTGGTKHVALTVSLSGNPATATLTLYLDGNSAGTATWTQTTGYLWTYDTMYVGGLPSGLLLTGAVSHVAFGITALSSTRIGVHRNAGLTGFIGELSGTRSARLLRLAGIDPALQNIEAGLSTMDYQDTTGAAPMTSLQDVVNAERGVFFAAGDGRLTFHGRSHRYNAGASATFDADADLGNPTLTSTLNDQLLINDVIGTRPGGAMQRSVNQASVKQNGSYAQSLTLLVDSDNLARDIVTSIANTYSVPQPRAPELLLDMLTISQAQGQAVLGLDVGARADVTNLPASAPASTLSLFVEGVSESVTPNAWEVKFATSPATYTTVWVLDSPTYSQLDSSTILSL